MGKKGTVFLSEALTDEYIMLEEQDDGLEAIIFNGITLAYYDRKTQSVVRIVKSVTYVPGLICLPCIRSYSSATGFVNPTPESLSPALRAAGGGRDGI
jgi:hypothetical protein